MTHHPPTGYVPHGALHPTTPRTTVGCTGCHTTAYVPEGAYFTHDCADGSFTVVPPPRIRSSRPLWNARWNIRRALRNLAARLRR